jgi:hypothetical protein
MNAPQRWRHTYIVCFFWNLLEACTCRVIWWYINSTSNSYVHRLALLWDGHIYPPYLVLILVQYLISGFPSIHFPRHSVTWGIWTRGERHDMYQDAIHFVSFLLLASASKAGYTLVTLPHAVTPYRDCGRYSWPRNVSNVYYAVTLRACSVRCRYLAVASK